VFTNILDNAIKHTSGQLILAVNISHVSHDGKSYYRVALDDNGSGIPDDKKEEVFDRFKRGNTKARGTGLGLYIVKTLVEGFGGYVEVQNRVLEDYTKGTRFLIYLPIMEEKDAGNE
jgi:signal transduction histidine kinase